MSIAAVFSGRDILFSNGKSLCRNYAARRYAVAGCRNLYN